MIVSAEEVQRIAALARLALSDAEATQMAHEMAGILAHMDALNEAEELAEAGAGEATGVTRPDLVAADPLLRSIEELSPHADSEFFTVPRLIGE